MSDTVVPKGQPVHGDPEKKGWLFKWTNYLKGYQRRWFVLSNGLLSYYRNQAEMAHTCRGTISLLGALIHTADSCTFVISNGGTQTFHIRAHDEVERQSWVTALELAKAKAIRAQESDDDDDNMAAASPGGGEDAEDPSCIARELAARFHDLRTCSELVARHGAALQRSLVDLEIPPSDTTKQVSERATLFRISCNAMMNACSEFMSAAAAGSGRLTRALHHEREQKLRLQEVVEQLARQHDNLEKTVHGRENTEIMSEDIFVDSQPVSEPSTSQQQYPPTVLIIPPTSQTTSSAAVSIQHPVLFTPPPPPPPPPAQTPPPPPPAQTPPPTSAPPTPTPMPHVTSATQSHQKTKNTILENEFNERQRRANELHELELLLLREKIREAKAKADLAELQLRSAGGNGQGNDTEDEEHEFFDAQEEDVTASHNSDPTSFVIKVPVNRKNQSKGDESSDESESETVTETQQVIFVEDKERAESVMGGVEPALATAGQVAAAPAKEDDIKVWPHVSQVVSMVDNHPRRIRVPDKPNYPLSLWSIMKNCIGKELSKIPIPVNFSEPLSMLQRLTEDYEYSPVLDQAAKFTDPAQQLAYVAAFTVSSYATTSCRTNKPFNPLLGETYECDRLSDLGWRSISEQVSHHPPMLAQWCEGAAGWQCWQEFTMTTKFRGKYLQIVPLGGASCSFPASGNKYTWRKVTTTVHNIIVGKLWVDNHGDMDIVGEEGAAAGYVAHLKYLPYGYFSKDTQRKVTGVIKDPNGVPRYVLQGHWDERVEVAPVTSASPDNTVCKTGKFVVAWERVPAPPNCDKWYNFTILAAQLNEPESGVAPTDSRLRPDQRLMEEGLWDEANAEKLRLEEKQRAKRRECEAEAEAAAARGAPGPASAKPVWFTRESVPAPGSPHLRHLYNDRYWECKQKQDWSQCGDIF